MKRKELNLTKEILELEYYGNLKSAKQIGEQFGVSRYIIDGFFKKFGIPKRTKSEVSTLKLGSFIGSRFGKLIVQKKAQINQKHSSEWVCQCDCGNVAFFSTPQIKNGYATSCGCESYLKRYYGEIPLGYLRQIKRRAEIRNFEYNLTPEYLWELFLGQNRLCSLSGVLIFFKDDLNKEQTASLDRIESSKGYVEDNVQWVHKLVNKLKMDMPPNDFLQWVKSIHSNNNQIKEISIGPIIQTDPPNPNWVFTPKFCIPPDGWL